MLIVGVSRSPLDAGTPCGECPTVSFEADTEPVRSQP
jgi:hypothetical protein